MYVNMVKPDLIFDSIMRESEKERAHLRFYGKWALFAFVTRTFFALEKLNIGLFSEGRIGSYSFHINQFPWPDPIAKNDRKQKWDLMNQPIKLMACQG